MGEGITLVILAGLCLVLFWLAEIVSLMRTTDTAFPGKYDKPLWVAILVFTFALGAVAFWFWRRTVQADRETDHLAGEIGGIIKNNQKPDQPR